MPSLVLAAALAMAFAPADLSHLAAHDRQVQAKAVQRLASSETPVDDELLHLWLETDRFDVREHIVRVYEARDVGGIPSLLELASAGPRITNDYGVANALLRALGRHPHAAMNTWLDDPERYGSHTVYIMSLLIREHGLDAGAAVDRLMNADDPALRASTVGHIVGQLTEPARSRVRLEAANDESPSVRANAFQRYSTGFGPWSEEDRLRYPNNFSQYISGVLGLIDSNDDRLVAEAIHDLIRNQATSTFTIDKLTSLFTDPDRHFSTRTEAMKAYLALHDSPSGAVRELLDQLDTDPMAVCVALATVDPSLIPDESIDSILQAIPRARTREDNYAGDLIARVGYGNRPRIGLRAMPQLIAALESDDAGRARDAIELLRALGSDAVEAVPSLIARLETDQNGASALLSIAPDDPRVRDALILLIESAGTEPHHRAAAGNALRQLMHIRPDDAWVQQLVKPALASEQHPLHPFVSRSPPPEFAPVMSENEQVLLERLTSADFRDQAWAFVQGLSSDEPGQSGSIGARNDEYHRRANAISALTQLEQPSDAVFEALLQTLAHPSINRDTPEGVMGIHSQRDRRAVWDASVWRTETAVAREAGTCLATLLGRRPEWIAPAVQKLAQHTRGLGYMLLGTQVPQDLDPRLIDACFNALSLIARESIERSDLIAPHALRQLGRLPTDDPRRLALLTEFVLYGPGNDVATPKAALTSIGFVRPMTPETLDFIAEHLDHIHPTMRSAAIMAFGNAGPHAKPYLSKILEYGRTHITHSAGTDVANAAKLIDHESPEVKAYLNDYIEAHRRLYN